MSASNDLLDRIVTFRIPHDRSSRDIEARRLVSSAAQKVSIVAGDAELNAADWNRDAAGVDATAGCTSCDCDGDSQKTEEPNFSHGAVSP